MALIPCKTKSLCFDPASPIANLSSEAPDVDLVRAVYDGPQDFPRIGSPWTDPGPGGGPGGGPPASCEVPVGTDPADAQACAASEYYEDVSESWPQPDGSPMFISGNSLQECGVKCPDGSEFTARVRADWVVTFNPDLSNMIAYQLACHKATTKQFCLSGLPDLLCDGETVDTVIFTILKDDATVQWSVSDGALPPGWEINPLPTDPDASTQSVHLLEITGGTDTPGIYTFTIRATAGDVYSEREYEVRIVKIEPDLTQPEVGVPYSVTFTAEFMGDDVTFGYIGDPLPAGLSFDAETATISGTLAAPLTEAVAFSITAQFEGEGCSRQYEFQSTSEYLWWKFDEEGLNVDVTDSSKGVVLTARIAPGSVATSSADTGVPGPVGDRARFWQAGMTAGGAEGEIIYEMAGPGGLPTNGSTKLTMCGWIRYLFQSGATNESRFFIRVVGPLCTDGWGLSVKRNAAGTVTWNPFACGFVNLSGNFSSPFPVGEYHFFVFESDPDADRVRIEFDRDGVFYDNSPNAFPPGDFISLEILVQATPNSGAYVILDQVGVFNRILTEDQKDYIYNGGSGRTYPIVFPP